MDFLQLAPAGHFVALRVSFAFPMEMRVSLPPDWVARYNLDGLLRHDPVMHWVYENAGAVRWSGLGRPDPLGVLDLAAAFGLRYGAAVAFVDEKQRNVRSFGGFARADREYTDAELDLLSTEVRRLHISRAPPTNLTEAELEALRMVKNGLLMKEIAGLLGVTEGAVQQRLKNAKLKLNANTSSQAVTLASGYGLI